MAGAPIRNRSISLSVVALYLLIAGALREDTTRRAALHYAVVLTLGYGHLIGAFWSSRRRRALAGAIPAGRRAIGLVTLASVLLAFLVFMECLAGNLLLVSALLAISTWHTAENDLALDDDRPGHRASARIDDQFAALGLTALILAAAAASLEPGDGLAPWTAGGVDSARGVLWLRSGALLFGAVLVWRETSPRHESIGLALIGAGVFLPDAGGFPRWLSFADLFAATTGYHLVSWIVRSVERVRVRNDGTGALLIAAHAVPATLVAIGLLVDTYGARALRAAFFAPAPYLFWSCVHVVDTWIQRRRRAGRSRSLIPRRADAG